METAATIVLVFAATFCTAAALALRSAARIVDQARARRLKRRAAKTRRKTKQ